MPGRGVIAAAAQRVQAACLLHAHLGTVDLQAFLAIVVGLLVAVDTHHDLFPRIEPSLRPQRILVDAPLHPAGFEGCQDATLSVDVRQHRANLRHHAAGQRLDQVGARPRVRHVAQAKLMLEDQLRIAGQPRGLRARQSQCLVKAVGMQRLRTTEDRGHRLDRGARDIVERLLRGERPARGLAMHAHRRGARAGAAQLAHDVVPQEPRGAQLGDLNEELLADAEEEAQSAAERIDIKAALTQQTDIGPGIGQC
ncbi:hypothetical protein D3C72_1139840 [compost metagenome]